MLCQVKLTKFDILPPAQHQYHHLLSSVLTTEREIHTGCSKNDALLGINCYFSVCTKVVQTALILKQKQHMCHSGDWSQWPPLFIEKM